MGTRTFRLASEQFASEASRKAWEKRKRAGAAAPASPPSGGGGGGKTANGSSQADVDTVKKGMANIAKHKAAEAAHKAAIADHESGKKKLSPDQLAKHKNLAASEQSKSAREHDRVGKALPKLSKADLADWQAKRGAFA